MTRPSAAAGLRQLVGAVLLIVAIGLPSCAAFNGTHGDRSADPAAHLPVSTD